MLSISPHSAHPPWQSSTLPAPTLLDMSHHSDNLHYASVQTSHLVHLAHRRLHLIRSGQDPDADPRDVQPRWNVSAKLEDEDRQAIEAAFQHSKSTHTAPPPGPDYLPLLTRELQWEAQQRQAKQHRQQQAQATLQRQALWKEWEGKEQWNGAPPSIATLPSAFVRPVTSEAAVGHSSALLAQTVAAMRPPVASQPAPHPLLGQWETKAYELYSHPGHWGWTGDRREWSCCKSGVETVRGCVVVGEGREKRRLVPVGAGRGNGGRGKVVRYEHGGVYERGVDGAEQWSCCSMGDREGRGCVARTIVKEHRWNLE